MENIKVAIWGFGAMGSGVAKVLLRKKGVDITGVCDIHPARVGKSIFEVLGAERGERADVLVSPDIEAVVSKEKCDICIIATDSFTNDVKYANMADGAATIAPWNTDIMPEDVIAKCDEMKDKIVNGEYTVMAGPLSDNKGNELLKDGETFNLEQLIDCYWLLDNVIGDLP